MLRSRFRSAVKLRLKYLYQVMDFFAQCFTCDKMAPPPRMEFSMGAGGSLVLSYPVTLLPLNVEPTQPEA